MSRVKVTAQISPLISNLEIDNYEITDLSFVNDTGKGKKKKRSFWHVKPNGNYADECLLGKSYALEALQCMIDKNTPIITWAVMAMPDENSRSGIEIGFLSTIAEFAVHGAITNSRRS